METLEFFKAYRGELAALATAFSWSAAVIFLKLAGQQVGSVPLNLFKNALTSVLFLGTMVLIGDPFFPELSAEKWFRFLLSAIMGVTLGDVFFVVALKRLGASLQAIIDCLYAPAIFLIAYLAFGEALSGVGLLGAGLVVFAVVFGADQGWKYGDQFRWNRDVAIGLAAGVVGQLLMAGGVLMVRDILRSESLIWVTAYRFIFANFVLFAWALYREGWGVMAVFKDRSHWKWSIPGTLLGPFAATLFWFSGFKYTDAPKAAVLNQLSSFFIIALAVVFLKERLTWRRLLASLLAFAGAVIVAVH